MPTDKHLAMKFFMSDGHGCYIPVNLEFPMELELTEKTVSTDMPIWNMDAIDVRITWSNNYRRLHGKYVLRGGKLREMRKIIWQLSGLIKEKI